MKEAILRIQIDDRQQVSVFASVDGVEERIFWSSYPLKHSFKDATIEARKWLLELRQFEKEHRPDLQAGSRRPRTRDERA